MISLSSMTNLSQKLKGNEMPSPKPVSAYICESLMDELESQIREAEKLVNEEEREEKRKARIADYSWLISVPKKAAFMSQFERIGLEDLASQVKPYETTQIMAEFRSAIEGNHRKPEELPSLLRLIIKKHIADRPEEEEDSALRWLSRSVSSLSVSLKTLRSHSSARVFPSTDTDEALDPRRVKSMSDFIPMRELPV